MIAYIKQIRNKIISSYKKKHYEKQYFKIIGRKVLDDNAGNDLIFDKINAGVPCFIARFGSTELSTILYYRQVRLKEAQLANYNDSVCIASGFFPFSDEAIDNFSKLYVSFIKNIDILGVWDVGEDKVADLFNLNIKLINLTAIEPYYFKNPWSRALEGKKVLVIHPFADSIKHQYARRQHLFVNKDILPTFDLKIIPAVQTVADNTQGFKDWFEALEYMCGEILKQDFDVAIIGAGAYGMPLGNFIKMKMGKVAIHMGGATQILFGIKGKRWDKIPRVKSLFNENWINPSFNERPLGLEKVEGGCYW